MSRGFSGFSTGIFVAPLATALPRGARQGKPAVRRMEDPASRSGKCKCAARHECGVFWQCESGRDLRVLQRALPGGPKKRTADAQAGAGGAPAWGFRAARDARTPQTTNGFARRLQLQRATLVAALGRMCRQGGSWGSHFPAEWGLPGTSSSGRGGCGRHLATTGRRGGRSFLVA